MGNILSFSFFIVSLCSMPNALAAEATLIKTLWGCSVPCESDEKTTEVFKAAHFGWCGTTVLTPEMMKQSDAACQSANQGRKVHAVRVSEKGLFPASCINSGNSCDQEGFARMSFNCAVAFPDKSPYPFHFTTCAMTGAEAWGAASQVCSNPEVPSQVPTNRVCVPDGQQSCAMR